MAVYDNSGSFSANKRKEKDSHPDIKGKATINGVEYWLDGWKKAGSDGTWYSLSFKPKDEQRSEPERRPQREDDDIPL
jgi:hypothetical protein